MSDDTAARKFVKPAHAEARIPDPAHPGLDLPPDGAEVPWDHYWIARERHGDVVIVEPDRVEAHGVEPASAAPEAPAAAPAASAGVPFMITKAQREQLAQRGFTADAIANMTPADAQAELSKPAPQAD